MEVFLMYIKAFVVGGLICTVGQLLLNLTKLTSGKILVIFLLSGIVLSAVGVYGYLVDFAGAGATVPIVGFGHVLAQGAIKGAGEGLFQALTGGLVAGAAGIVAAVVFGYLFSVVFTPKTKKMK